MTPDKNQPSIASVPAAIAAVLAAIGVAGMIFLFVSGAQVADSGLGMKSADVAYRAGATITPTAPGSTQPTRSLPAAPITVADEARRDL